MEKIWLDSYENGVAHEIDTERYQSVVDVFKQSVEQFADKPAFHSMGVEISYRQTAKLAADFASYLQNVLKLPRGERVAVMMPNLLQYPIAVFGILQAGLVVVNTNPLYTPRELEHQLKDSGATAIVVLENFANTLEWCCRAPRSNTLSLPASVICSVFSKALWLNFVLRRVRKQVPDYRIPHAVPFKRALAQGGAQTLQEVPLAREDLAFLQYTGGTTGVAKGAMLTHGNICANMMQGAEWIKCKLQPGHEVFIAALPLYHIFALTVNLMITIQAGSKAVLIANPRDIDGFIAELGKHRITVFIGVNTLF